MPIESTFPTGRIAIDVPGAPEGPPIVPLPADALACGLCGVAVEAPYADVERVDLGHDWHPDPAGGAGHSIARHRFLDTALCAQCSVLRDDARHALVAHRVVARRLGSVATERLVGALAAYSALGLRLPALASAADVTTLLEHVVGGRLGCLGCRAARGRVHIAALGARAPRTRRLVARTDRRGDEGSHRRQARADARRAAYRG